MSNIIFPTNTPSITIADPDFFLIADAGSANALSRVTASALKTYFQTGVIANLVEDTTPQLGGDLDMNGKNIEGITPTEMAFMGGVTSGIQSQIDGKAPSLGGDDNYVTDAEKVVIGNTSGINTGDQTNISGNAATVTTNANLTGIVTSVGNATAIANKAIAIAKLADGIDGELITWSALGVIETVAVGTANQVLTSNGVGKAPTFKAAASELELSIEFAENISAGELGRIIDDSGPKAKLLIENVTPTTVTIDATSDDFIAQNLDQNGLTTIYDSTNTKSVVYWVDLVGGLQAKVATVSATSIAYGSLATVNATVAPTVNNPATTFNPNAGKSVIFYQSTGGGGKDAAASVGTVSGTGITFGTEADVETVFGDKWDFGDAASEISTSKVVCVWLGTGNDDLLSRVGTISGTSISFGTRQQITATVDNQNPKIVFDSTADKFVCAYNIGSNVEIKVGSVSGTGISWGTEEVITAAGELSMAYDSTNDRTILRIGGNAYVGTVSGTDITFGSGTAIPNSQSNQKMDYDAVSDTLLFASNDTGVGATGYVTIAQTNGSSITVIDTDTTTTANVSGDAFGFHWDAGALRAMFSFEGSSIGTAKTVSHNGGDQLQATEYFIIAKETKTAGQTGLVTLLGGINANQSGLTPGAEQFIDDLGAMTEVDQSNGSVGRAISATEVLLSKNP